MDAELKAQLEALKRRVGDEKFWQIGVRKRHLSRPFNAFRQRRRRVCDDM
jgi:hypothetical protein